MYQYSCVGEGVEKYVIRSWMSEKMYKMAGKTAWTDDLTRNFYLQLIISLLCRDNILPKPNYVILDLSIFRKRNILILFNWQSVNIQQKAEQLIRAHKTILGGTTWLMMPLSDTGMQYTLRAESRFAPSQREVPLQSNTVSHWLGANLVSALTLNVI